MNTTLVIMAAGLGSRFRGGKKQLEPIGLNGEVLMEYSIHDALEAGFNKVVFIVRDDFLEEFKEKVGDKIEKYVNVEYAFQSLYDIPFSYDLGKRKKPWGTGQAILAIKDIVKEPFCVINADDYYGKEGFKKIHNFLTSDYSNDFCMVGYELAKTLSENGGVSRGICMVGPDDYLIEIKESYNIAAVGDIILSTSGELNPHSIVSTNMWGFKPTIFSELEKQFSEFLKTLDPDDIRSEFLIPDFIDSMLKEKKVKVKVLKTNDTWLGITYHDDIDEVKKAFRNMYMNGTYKENLFEEKTWN